MAGTRTAPAWRGAFLRALARGGKVQRAADEAGVHRSTPYLLRRRNPGFADEWERAAANAAARKARRADGPAEARWSRRGEACFLAHFASTGCVRSAARRAGFSTDKLFARRRDYPDFAALWQAAEDRAVAHLHSLLLAAGIGSLDPGAAQGEETLPKVSVGEAIAILRLKGERSGRGAGDGDKAEEPDIETVRDEVLRRLAAIRRHRDGRGEGG